MSSAQSQVPLFEEKDDFVFYVIKTRTSLCSYGLWNFINDGCLKPTNYAAEKLLTAQKTKLDENCKKDKKTLSLIHQGISHVIFIKIATTQNAKEAWEMLEMSYKGGAKAKAIKLQNLRRDFENLKMKDSNSVEQ